MNQARIYETHVNTKNLEQAIEFYRDQLDLELAYVIEERRAAFFYLGEAGKKEFMLGVWEVPDTEFHTSHFAFYLPYEELLEIPAFLESKGIKVRGSFGLGPSEPIVHCWMPAASIYFRDPDGNSLEYLTLLEGKPQPERGAVHLSEWRKINGLQ